MEVGPPHHCFESALNSQSPTLGITNTSGMLVNYSRIHSSINSAQHCGIVVSASNFFLSNV